VKISPSTSIISMDICLKIFPWEFFHNTDLPQLFPWDIFTSHITLIPKYSYSRSRILLGIHLKIFPGFASSAKPICFWRLGNPPIQSVICPCDQFGRLSCTDGGSYIMGSGSLGQIYVRELSTWQLVNSWNTNEKFVSCLIQSNDDLLFFLGGDDGFANVWSILEVYILVITSTLLQMITNHRLLKT